MDIGTGDFRMREGAARIFLVNLDVFLLVRQKVIPSSNPSDLDFSEASVVCWSQLVPALKS